MPSVDRRRFLLAALATPLVAWLPACGRRDGETEAIVAAIRDGLGSLRLDDADLRVFAREFLARADRRTLASRATDPAGFVYEVCNRFLLSTDFFGSGADETRPIRYTAYYDPYLGCRNPFARLDSVGVPRRRRSDA